MAEKEEKNLFYTKLFEKCSPKPKETGEFEECCKEEAGNAPKNSLIDKAEKVIYKIIDKNIDKMDESIDNGK